MGMFLAPYVAPALAAVPSESSDDGPSFLGFVVCGVFLVVGVRMLVKERRLRSAGIRVPGVVTHLAPSMKARGNTIYHPVFAFTTADGRELQVRSPVGTDMPGVSPGQHVTVVYEAANPEDARIDTPTGRGALFAWLFVGFAVVFLILQLFPGAIDAIPGYVMLFAMGVLIALIGAVVIRQAGRRRRRARRVDEVTGAVVTLVQAPSYFAGGVFVLIGSIMTLVAIFTAS